jgi:glutaredoxin 3
MHYTRVVVYSTSNSSYCLKLIDWLNDRNIKFVNILVDRNEQAALEMIHKTKQRGVPVTIIEYADGKSQYIIGFDQIQLTNKLGLNNLI